MPYFTAQVRLGWGWHHQRGGAGRGAVSGMVHVKEVGQRLTALLQAYEKGGSVTYDKFKVCGRCLVLPAGDGLQR